MPTARHILIVNSRSVHQPVFVVGAPHSGADLIGRALKASAGFHVTIGQPSVLRTVYAFARRPSMYQGRTQAAATVIRDAFAQGWQVTASSCLECTRECRTAAGLAADAVGPCAELRGLETFGDASPDLIYCAEALTYACPDARIVQVIRDGRDVVASMLADPVVMSWFRPSFVNVDTEFFGRIALTYSTDLFEAETAQRMLAQYLELIAQTVANPDRALSSYRLLNEAQRRQILVDWNETRTPYPSTARTDELIAAQARRTPRAIAVSMGERRLSYADLETRANQLAHFLRRRGAEPRARIGICMERSPEMVVALLAVQKCGAAYVPLDPSFPQSRLQFMAEDAGLTAILTESALPGISRCNRAIRRPPRRELTTPYTFCTRPARPDSRKASRCRTARSPISCARCATRRAEPSGIRFFRSRRCRSTSVGSSCICR